MKSELLINLIGTENWQQFTVGLFFLFLGIFVSLILHANTRDVHSPRSAIAFSYRFLFNDNLKRLLFSILLSVILYRFAPNVINMQDNMYVAFLIGFGFDKIIQKFKEYFKPIR